MARELNGSDRDAVSTVCPLQCPLRYGAAGDNYEQVDWAGLPTNLDLVFSRQHRDEVYLQHQMRKRGSQLWRWMQGRTQLCVCDLVGDPGSLDAEAATSLSSR